MLDWAKRGQDLEEGQLDDCGDDCGVAWGFGVERPVDFSRHLTGPHGPYLIRDRESGTNN